MNSEKNGKFPETRWSIILAAADPRSELSRSALETLCRTYWPPLYAFLRRNGCTPEQAEDTVQGFIARLLERNDLATLGPGSGRFRSYLLAGLRNFLVSGLRREGAQRRGAAIAHISVDDEETGLRQADLVAAGISPERAFDQRWAQTIIETSLQKLERECYACGKEELFRTLRSCLAGTENERYDKLGEKLGLSRQAVALAVHRLRLRLRDIVRSEVMQTVGSASDAREEMRYLMTLWQT